MRPTTRLTPLLTNLKPYISRLKSECPRNFEHGFAFQTLSIQLSLCSHNMQACTGHILGCLSLRMQQLAVTVMNPCAFLVQSWCRFAMRNLNRLSPDLMLNAIAPG